MQKGGEECSKPYPEGTGGFAVVDYGTMDAAGLVEKVKNDGVEILLISTLMLHSALHVGDLKRGLDAAGCNIKIVVGGAPFRLDGQLWKEVGADAVGYNGSDALTIIARIIDAFFYAPIEVEAWGAEVIYSEDGPPNSGMPFVEQLEDIKSLGLPKVTRTPCLVKVLKAIEMLKARVGDDAPIIGVVMSPFSLRVVQIGFERYMELIYERPDQFRQWLLSSTRQLF